MGNSQTRGFSVLHAIKLGFHFSKHTVWQTHCGNENSSFPKVSVVSLFNIKYPSRRGPAYLVPTCTSANTNSLPHLHYCRPHHLSAFCSSLLHYSAFSAPLSSSCPPFPRQPPRLSISPIPLFPHGACWFFTPLSSPFCFPLSHPALPCLFVRLASLLLWGGGSASVAFPS